MNEETPKLEELLASLQNANQRLQEAVAQNPEANDLAIDGTVQRFEFTFELAWKVMQAILWEREEIRVPSPKRALQEAYKLDWISEQDEALWSAMLKDRNLTSHTYKEPLAMTIYEHIKAHYAAALSAMVQTLERVIKG